MANEAILPATFVPDSGIQRLPCWRYSLFRHRRLFSSWLHNPTIEAAWSTPWILVCRPHNRDLTRQAQPFRRLSACCC